MTTKTKIIKCLKILFPILLICGIIWQISTHQNKNQAKNQFKQTVESKEDLPDKTLIVLYDNECKDCIRNYKSLKDLADQTKVEYVDSNSQLGEELASALKVDWVPSVILWDKQDNQYSHIKINDLSKNKKEIETVKEFADLVNK